MRRSTLARSWCLSVSNRSKSVSYRSLRMESLEKRVLLSAVAGSGDLLDANGRLTQGGWLVYSVTENETANRNTCITVNGVQLGGDGGDGETRVQVNAGDSLPGFTSSEGQNRRLMTAFCRRFGGKTGRTTITTILWSKSRL